MTNLETSLSEQEFTNEVRNALAGLNSSKIPDNTILQAKNRVVEPLLNDARSYEASDQDAFDNASVMWSAEFAFDAWLTFTRLRDAEIGTYVDPDSYKEDLENRTNQVLGVLDITRPPEIPQTVVSVQHDGEKRAVDLSEEWKVE